MGKSGVKSIKVIKKSSGFLRKNRASRDLRKINAKIRRWNRYNEELHLGRTWDTSGLKKRAKQLDNIVKLGSKLST